MLSQSCLFKSARLQPCKDLVLAREMLCLLSGISDSIMYCLFNLWFFVINFLNYKLKSSDSYQYGIRIVYPHKNILF